MSVKYVISESGNISAFVDNKPYLFTSESENYTSIVTALASKDIPSFKLLIGDMTNISESTDGFLDYKDGVPVWQDIPLPSVLVDRVLELVKQGYEFGPILNFLHNLCENPSDHSVVELLDFLKNKNLPLTTDGCFLGYKAVRADYLDKYSGTISNKIGNIVSIPREEVDPNRTNECSYGLHVGALEYVQNQYYKDGDRILVVKVNPKHVITVPRDYSFQKLRCCEYTVLAQFTEPLGKAVYSDVDFVKMAAAKTEEAVATIESESINEVVKAPGWKEKIGMRLKAIVSYLNLKR
jgi:hypothetical protein